jgi:hypothetical protein
MQTIRTSRKGIEYLVTELKSKKTVSTQVMVKAVLQKIPHHTEDTHICLKIGRYATSGFGQEVLESEKPKSELTLDEEEFQNLVQFISDNIEPMKDGVKRYICIDDDFDLELAEKLRGIFAHEDKGKVLEFLVTHDLMPEEILHGLESQKRMRAVEEFQEKLQQNLVEYDWQKWFQENSWVLGSEYVRVLEERAVDTENIVDYFMEAYDGFLDVIEIKRPEGGLQFWREHTDHGNIIPHTDLVEAVTQATNYIYEVEREMNSDKFLERIGRIPVVKPRAVLIFGRSDDWTPDQKKAYRLLNASYHNLTVLTYDHVLERAKRMLGHVEQVQPTEPQEEAAPQPIVELSQEVTLVAAFPEVKVEDLPF